MNAKSAKSRKRKMITVRVTDKEYGRLCKRSEKENMKLSEYVRESALSKDRSVKGLKQEMIRKTVETQEALNMIAREVQKIPGNHQEILDYLKEEGARIWGL